MTFEEWVKENKIVRYEKYFRKCWEDAQAQVQVPARVNEQFKSGILCEDKLRKWAESKIGCSHDLCSLHESIYEEKYGREVLDILDGKF